MSKKQKRSGKKGTYAIWITVGLVLGLGLGPAMGSVPISIVVGGLLGLLAAYLMTRTPDKAHHHSRK